MRNEFQKAFDNVRAEEALKAATLRRLQDKLNPVTPQKRPVRFRAAAAVCALVLLSLTVLSVLYFRVDAYISIDINPSVELGLNLFGRVVSVKGWNDAGEALAELEDVSNKPYQEAVEVLVQSPALKAYVNEASYMVLTVAGGDQAVLAALAQVDTGTETDLRTCAVEDAVAAHSHGVSLGRYELFLQIQALQPDFTAEQCMAMSMRDLRDLLVSLGEEPDANPSGNGNGAGAGNGDGTGAGNGNGTGAGNGNGTGAGNGNGTGAGNGNGTGAGNGDGTGAGNGKGRKGR